jgi:hypothetical protein
MPDRDSHQAEFPVVDIIVKSIADWVNKFRDATGNAGGLANCDSEEVMAIASDLGLSPYDLKSLAQKGPESIPLLRKMLVALNIDEAALIEKDPLVMRDLQRLCTQCSDQKRCRHELEAGTAAAHFHDFCPNAFTLDALFEHHPRPTAN